MIPLALAFSLFLAGEPAADAPAPPPPEAAEAPQEEPLPSGAPSDDYQFVAWCYGLLGGYLELHDEVMPEVKRIETTWRRPGSNLADDLKVYADQQAQGRRDMARFKAALTAAEKASLKPINILGAKALQRGHAAWNHGPDVTKARLAQEWMSWALPKRCVATAETLHARATLLGASFQVNAEPDPAPEASPTPDATPAAAAQPTPDAPSAPAPSAEPQPPAP